MRPVSVRFKCFGPYMAEQFIDFSLLEKNGLFLICGETGAGKTTILDAMCYALYCESSGGKRGGLESMRCKLADRQDDTEVEFIFDNNGRRYRFTRILKAINKRKSKEPKPQTDKKTKSAEYNDQHCCYVLQDDVWMVLEDKQTAVNKRAERIVGLTKDQFRQVIILPQGQFERFLVAGSEEKENILATLFNVEQWSRICEEINRRINAKAAVLNQEKSAIAEGLRRYGCESVEALAEKRMALELSLEMTKAAAQKAAKALAAAEDAYAAGKVDSERFAQLDWTEQRFQKLKQQEDHMVREAAALAMADAADRLQPVFTEFCAADSAARRAEEEMQKARNGKSEALEALAKADSELTAHEAGREKQEENRKWLLTLEQARAVYASLEDLRREAEEARKTWAGAETILQQKRAALEKLDRELAEAFAGQTRAKERYDQVQIAYRKSIGGILAQLLEEGKACPVCGSTSHPNPARQEQGHVSEQELDQRNKELTRWGSLVSHAIQSRALGEKARNEAQERETLAKEKLDSARNRLELALAQRVRGIENAAELEKCIQELQWQIRFYEQQGKKLLDARTGAEGARAAAELAVENCEKQQLAVRETLALRKKHWERMLTESEFTGEEDFLAAAVEPARKQMRYRVLAAWQGDLKAAQRELEEQKQRLEGRIRPDLARSKEARDRAETESKALSGQQILDEKLLCDMTADEKKLVARLEANREALIILEGDQIFARRLAGSHGVGLQRYVLGVMMNAITAQANRLLENVYGGRYRLHRTDETSGRTMKGGLELEVSDSHNSQRRSVRTLSGGEKFLVALSLAIGLSTVVQAQGEGIRLEAMFIDEGFGSLDRESIQDALEILQSIRNTAGVVGIISHVDALAETIPAQLRITKGKNGSHCRLSGL